MSDHKDSLSELNTTSSLSKKLESIHKTLVARFDAIDRIAVALYDPKTDVLNTFLHSSGGALPLSNYEAKLSESYSLNEIVRKGTPRVVNDLDIFAGGMHEHTRKIAAEGYGSSYTLPMYLNGNFFGFVFFNSYQKNTLDGEVLHFLDLVGHLVSLVVLNELSAVRTLISTVQAARDVAHFRDMETGAHLDRMSHFSRVIARELAPEHGFDDEFVEHVFLFAPLHDIGKIGIPDRIMLKAGKLTGSEFEIMQTHPMKGRQIIDTMLKDFALDSFQHIDMLRNIAEFHHEAMDGSGYPRGLKKEQIPIEARIISVADIFDALTSRRPYKVAWSNDEAFRLMQTLAGTKLDPECVEALLKNRNEIEAIQQQFSEDLFA